MKWIMDILKGMVMGIANVIPGVSGGTMAVAMGIYDRLINALTHIFKDFKKSVITVLPIGIGMVIGVVGLSMVIEWMFGTIPIQTNLLFIGLIIGGVPAIWERIKGKKINAGHIIGFILFMALVIGLSFVQAKTEAQKEEMDQAKEAAKLEASAESSESKDDFHIETGVIETVGYTGAGVVAAGTMVIPGVSGSMMMMVMGLYEKIVGSISNLVKAIPSGDWDTALNCIGLLVPFGIGAVIGIFAIAKLIEMLLSKFEVITFWCIMGLIVGSPVAIIVVNSAKFAKCDAVSILTGIVALAIGFAIAFFLGKEPEIKEAVEKNSIEDEE